MQKKSITQRVKPVVILVTEPMVKSKKAMKRNGNPHKNSHKCITKSSQKKGTKEAASWTNFCDSYWIETSIESEYCRKDREWKSSFKTKDENIVLFQASVENASNKEKGKAQVPQNRGKSRGKKAKSFFEDSQTVAHPRSDEIFPMEILVGRWSKQNLDQSRNCAPK